MPFVNVVRRSSPFAVVRQWGTRFRPVSRVFSTKSDKLKNWRENFEFQNPIRRTGRILKNDLKFAAEKVVNFLGWDLDLGVEKFERTCTDLLIIGDGVLGSSIAYWLKQRAPHAMDVTVVGGMTNCYYSNELGQHFISREKIEMSRFCREYLKKLPDVRFSPRGQLHFADEAHAQLLMDVHRARENYGSRSVLLTKSRMGEKFPWLDLNGIEIGCLGLEGEGWFDVSSLLEGLYHRNIEMGVNYVNADILGFNFKRQDNILTLPSVAENKVYHQLDKIVLEKDGKPFAVKFAYCILAAETGINCLLNLAKIGEAGEGILTFEPRQRFLHFFDGPPLNTPLVSDGNLTFHPDGFRGLVVKSFKSDCEDISREIRRRIPTMDFSFRQTEVGNEEVNVKDGNGIIGPHPIYHNFLFACGFEAQHAPAVGRAVMEMILDGEFKTIHLGNFSFDQGPPHFTHSILPIRAASKSCLTEFTQRVMSGKLLQLKQYQNQLYEAATQLQAARDENKSLTRLLKRHETSLKRYEGENAGMPRLLRSHAEEVRTLRTTVHQLRTELRDLHANLREKDAEVVALKDQIAKLRGLGEENRVFDYEKAQKKIDNLQQINDEQAKEIQLLSRRILLETKTNQRILQTELSKHKETKKELESARTRIDRLEAQKKAILFGYTGNGLNLHQCLRADTNDSTRSRRRESLVPVLPSQKRPDFRAKQQQQQATDNFKLKIK